jgi:hypothetical protein
MLRRKLSTPESPRTMATAKNAMKVESFWLMKAWPNRRGWLSKSRAAAKATIGRRRREDGGNDRSTGKTICLA